MNNQALDQHITGNWGEDSVPDDLPNVPESFPVKVLGPDDPATDRMLCEACGREWDDAIATGWTPVPAARCPFEYFHGEE